MKLSFAITVSSFILFAPKGKAQELHPDIVAVVPVVGANPGNGWHDSYSVGDKCYCDSSTFDHKIGAFPIETPLGWMTVQEACQLLGPGPGSSGRPKYNDIQCGNGPPNDAGDEHTCPGRSDIGPEGCGQIGPKWDWSSVVLLETPTVSPVASPTSPAPVVPSPTSPAPAVPSPTSPAPVVPAPTTPPVAGPQPLTSYFVNCGGGEEDLLSGSYWTDTTGQSISNTSPYEETLFKTARSGNGFTYTITGFAPGVAADITLGWAELWKGACPSGKRKFDVTVNGAVFVTDMDVGDTAGGCYNAVMDTKSFEADSSGTFTLSFSKGSIQNPLINVIDIQVI